MTSQTEKQNIFSKDFFLIKKDTTNLKKLIFPKKVSRYTTEVLR